jgi:hypothetical protein
MFKEQMGSIARTLLTAGSGVSLGLLVESFDISPETLSGILEFLEKMTGSMQGFLSLLGILIAQGWSLHQKMQKSREINKLKVEATYND